MIERDCVIALLTEQKPQREVLESEGIVETLISILIDEELGAADHPRGGYSPIHAARLLGELRAEAAIGPMLEVLRNTEWDAIIHDMIIQSLPLIGAPVVEPALAAYLASEDEELRSSVAGVLAGCGVRDERLFKILIERFEEDLDDAGLDLGTYGDPRALENIVLAFDEFELADDGDPAFANGMLVDLRESIEELGGKLTIEQEAKFEIAMQPAIEQRDLAASMPATHRQRPGRNEVCWCGSTRKYKKCHLETDELNALKN